ncbi:hypothetical protein VST7929_01523 [Vibrio stylophorae]|uniref:Nitrous oxide-stimulated promoter family protein n=1 Tax=Vibrio stylophorae TaxID=659351 RepID=A0ABN8DWB0_9VIBR|nr:nitrous oxide-stimulated promoter family protein [Vibrio stylophorae]CAH0533652.1 hypothetical protein VST7929_01523 [Vibrio stylophorae]
MPHSHRKSPKKHAKTSQQSEKQSVNPAERLSRRLAREHRTFVYMTQLYCHKHHQHPLGSLCDACASLMAYAAQKLDRCPYGDDKPTCVKCPIHCYKAKEREQSREIMRYSGPRMLVRHPILAILHLIDGRQPVPEQPSMRSNRQRRKAEKKS